MEPLTTIGPRWPLVRGAAVAGLVTLSGCFNPAVSPAERIARACGYYADALESASPEDALYNLGDAAHWAELAKEKDESFGAVEAALGHIVDELDADDDVRPDPDVLTESRNTLVRSCDEHAERSVSRRIKERSSGTGSESDRSSRASRTSSASESKAGAELLARQFAEGGEDAARP